MKMISNETIEAYRKYLISEEKAPATIEKYIRDIRAFARWLGVKEWDKEAVLQYKSFLCGRASPASVNSVISSLNSFFAYGGRPELRVRALKVQRQVFSKEERELSKAEYERLLKAAKQKHNERLYLLMSTICSTGIRVSELRSITAEAVRRGRAEIRCKGKCRTVFLPDALCRMLSRYLREQKRKSGPVFVTKNGNPLDRSNIWSDMKRLCRSAGVNEKKVFPHNLRHLFARTFYTIQKDIVRLADILGHSSVNTTRIYTTESGEIHRRRIQCLGLLRC